MGDTIYLNFRLRGGGKRARGSGGDAHEPSGNIAEIIGDIVARDGDLPEVRKIVSNPRIDIEDWLNNLTVEDLENLKMETVRHINAGGSDTAIRSFAQFLHSLNDIKVAQKRLDDIAKYELHKFKKSFLAYTHDAHGGTHKVERFRMKVEDVLKEKKKDHEQDRLRRAVTETREADLAAREADLAAREAAMAAREPDAPSLLSRVTGRFI